MAKEKNLRFTSRHPLTISMCVTDVSSPRSLKFQSTHTFNWIHRAWEKCWQSNAKFKPTYNVNCIHRTWEKCWQSNAGSCTACHPCSFFDDGNGLRGNKNVTLSLNWNVIPTAGTAHTYAMIAHWANVVAWHASTHGVNMHWIECVSWFYVIRVESCFLPVNVWAPYQEATQ